MVASGATYDVGQVYTRHPYGYKPGIWELMYIHLGFKNKEVSLKDSEKSFCTHAHNNYLSLHSIYAVGAIMLVYLIENDT